MRALIDSFGNVLKDPDPACGFPCTRCPDHDACYGENRASQTRIVPFSFYPFYLLIFDSLSLPALDFLRLVSGASLDELISTLSAKSELGRVSCLEEVRRNGLVGSPLFSIHDERYFLEVLYLKLSFLGDVFRQIFPPQGITGQPEMKLTIDRIWVGLAGQSGFLPPFWNFRTKILDIVRPSGVSQLFTSPVSSNLLQAALLWFYALLVNNRQSSRDLMISLKEAISGNISLTGIPSSIHSTNPVFSPEQIFWEPDGKAVHRNRVPLWEKSIDMGFELLHAATHPDQQWSCESFFVNFEKYRAEVREAMFGNASLTIERPSQDYQLAEDENIHKILTGIIGKWRVSGKVETLPKRSEEAAEMTDTIILSSARIDTPASSIRDEEEWTETVILSARNEIVTPSPHSQFRDGAVLETVVLSPVRATSEPITPTLLEEVEDDVPQTIILSPGLRPEETIVVKKVPEGSPIGAVKEDIAHGDDLPETVMLNPQKARFKSKGWKD
ncbi:MAG: hypothetical protein HXX11_06540 [Desulfuromonadales bacterium]|nr:hypothetical protein [Desulfuromonadales bacterium]